jgi:hypothetical protein
VSSPGPRAVIITNPGDDAAITTHLAALGGLPAGRAVIRPTPGAAGLGTLGLDLLAAAGKAPRPGPRPDHPPAWRWDLARAWLTGHQVSDLVADRAHRLDPAQLTALAGLAADLGASLWLVWGSTTDATPAAAIAGQITGRPVVQLPLHDLPAHLPAWSAPTAPPDTTGAWAPLPEAEFTTFLAACRRHLPPADFAAAASRYHDTAEAADIWADEHQQLAAQSMRRYTSALTGWLRDISLGPAPTPAAALVQLRAIQAALFLRGILLRWDTTTLGPDPAARLPGDLTPGRAAALDAMHTRTDIPAAAALCLHLNHRPARLGHLTLGHLAPDGSVLHGSADPDGDPGQPEQIRIPSAARPILAAHLAFRRRQGAADTDPCFTGPPGSATRPGTLRHLHNAITRASHDAGYDLPWMHDDSCTHGADIGLAPRTGGWLVERHLSLYRIDPVISAQVPRSRPASRNRPPPAMAPDPFVPARRTDPDPSPFRQRLAASGLSARELADLAGIHPHLLSSPPDLDHQPVHVLIQLARALQLQPADLHPGLTTTPARHPGASSADRDAVTLLTALAWARTPLTPADLATALDWPLAHTATVLEHAAARPHLGGPLMLRRVPPHAYTTTPRTGILTDRQQQDLASAATPRDTLTPDQATVLVAVVAFGPLPRYASYRETCPHTEHTLKQAGLIRNWRSAHHAVPAPEIAYSLRCPDRNL